MRAFIRRRDTLSYPAERNLSFAIATIWSGSEINPSRVLVTLKEAPFVRINALFSWAFFLLKMGIRYN